ncbi:glycosyltransferase family 4 protein [Macrococcus animalis]|uniref:glycosyltransferase family 4 protein n=1 Tax=Macrococcus animalis TaxID=3395467 RepID=UPI0039BE03F5
MKKVLMITQNFYPEIGSAANRMKNIFNQLSQNGYEVYVLTTEPSYPNEKMYKEDKYWNDSFINDNDEKIIRLRMRHEKHKGSMSSRVAYYSEFMLKVHYFVNNTRNKFDYLFITSPNIFVPWGALFLQKNNSTVKILEIRDLWPDSIVAIDKININIFMPALKILEKKMYLKSDKIVVNNEYFIHHIQNIIKKNMDYLFIPNGINRDEVVSTKKFEDFSVIYTGNLGFAQDTIFIEQIAKQLNDEKIRFNAIVYGVNARDFKEFVDKNNLNYVNVLDPMPRQECLDLTAKHHVSVSILKDTEVFLNVMPGKVVDSICTNVPVVTNLGGYTNNLINDNKVGFAKSSATPSEISNIILEYRNNPEKLKKHSNNTKKLKEKYFIWEENIKKLIQFMG